MYQRHLKRADKSTLQLIGNYMPHSKGFAAKKHLCLARPLALKLNCSFRRVSKETQTERIRKKIRFDVLDKHRMPDN